MSRTIFAAALAAVLLAGPSLLSAQTVPPGGKQDAAKLIAVLKSDAPHKEKADACRQLAVVGNKDAVPALAALLGDEKLSHMARYGLEPIPDPAVDDVLREALGKLKGRVLVGVIGSVGVRRDAKAVPALAKMLQDTDADVAQGAARALGKIGTPEAAKALQGALAGVAPANQVALCEGLFRAAEALAAASQRELAVAIYDQLRALSPAPHQVRAGGLRGAILTREKEGLALLRENLQSKDWVLFAAALRTAREMTGAEVTQALAAALGQLDGDHQVMVIQALGNRKDAAGLPAVAALAKSAAKPVRMEAIRVLPQFGQASIAADLIEWMADTDTEIARAAQESLAGLPGAEVDKAVLAMFAGQDNQRRLAALELIGQRRMIGAVAILLKATGDADSQIRAAVLRRLGELGSPSELPALTELLMRATPQDLGPAEQAVSALCAKAENPESCTEKLVALLPQAQPAQKAALLRVLASVGGENALKAVRSAIKDGPTEIRMAAIRALGGWKSPDALPDLLALAQNAANPTDKILALRGYLAWATNQDLPLDQRLAIGRQAAGIVQKPDEKKLLLGALGNVAAPGALELIVPYLEDPAVKAEAVAAAVNVAERVLKARDANRAAPKLIQPLEKVVEAASGDQAQRAKAALQQARAKAPPKRRK